MAAPAVAALRGVEDEGAARYFALVLYGLQAAGIKPSDVQEIRLTPDGAVVEYVRALTIANGEVKCHSPSAASSA